MGNFLVNDARSYLDGLEGIVTGIGGVMAVATGGGTSELVESGRHWKNYGYDVANAFTGEDKRDDGTKATPLTAAQVAANNLKRATDPNAPWNKTNWQVYKGVQTNSLYSPQSGLGGVVKPSDLQNISNPDSKMLTASTRGNTRAAVNTMNAARDNLTANAIHQAVNSDNPPKPLEQPSDNINSAGGSGASMNNEKNQNSFT
jgi:hypothetical protein